MDPIILLVLFVLFGLGKKAGGNGGGGTGPIVDLGGVDVTPDPVKPGKLNVPDLDPIVTPDPDPDPDIGGIDTGGGGPPDPGPAGPLTISPDCTVVVESPTWWAESGLPVAESLVAQGNGLPFYTVAQADRSVDAVVRTIVATTAGSACIDSAPWLDRYAKAHPFPVLSEGQTREGYLFELAAWDDAWDATISSWAAAHPAAFALFKKIGTTVAIMWANGQDIMSLGTGPGDPGVAPPSGQGGKATAAEVGQLRQLGYDISPDAAEYFQQDYNLVRNYQTNYGWRDFGLEIETDGVVGPQTRTALNTALSMAGGSPDQWRVMVAAANAG